MTATNRDIEIREIRDLQASGIISAQQAEARALAVIRKYAMTTTEPVAAAAEAAAAAAPVVQPAPTPVVTPTVSARDGVELRKGSACNIAPQPLPQPYDKKTGKPIPTGLESITVRAAEDGQLQEVEYYDKRTRTTKKKSVYVGNGRPTGRIAIDVSYSSKLSLSYGEWLQLVEKWDEIVEAVEKVVDTCQPTTVKWSE